MSENHLFDRKRLHIKDLSERQHKLNLDQILIDPSQAKCQLSKQSEASIQKLGEKIIEARQENRPVVIAFGAHVLKNGLQSILNHFLQNNLATHYASNGATFIHDWELAFQGQTAEDVQRYVSEGQFGIWQETGRWIHMAIALGAWRGQGYAEAIGQMIHDDALHFPDQSELQDQIVSSDTDLSARAANLNHFMKSHQLKAGEYVVKHPYKKSSLAYQAYCHGGCMTAHPMYGHDIIYTHPMTHGASIGYSADIDFLKFAKQIEMLEGGVYISLGSAIMSPMIFEKAFSMAQNIAISKGKAISNHHLAIVDLADAPWDWSQAGEPPSDNPAYYLRFLKTFHRMGGKVEYIAADHRDVLLKLYQIIQKM